MTSTPADIAECDGRRLACVLEEVGGAGQPLAGGWMACDTPGSWAHYAAGLGISRPFTDVDAAQLIAFYDAHGRPAEVQATPYQHESVFSVLGAHEFVFHSSETVLTRAVVELPKPCATEDALTFVRVDPADPALVSRFCEVHLAGFYTEGEPPAGARPIVERVVADPRVTLWIVEQGGQTVASAGIETFERSAVLIAGSVLPPFRRGGVQRALIRQRLEHAAALGAEYALIGSAPAGPTERNALRAGFTPAYQQFALRRGTTA